MEPQDSIRYGHGKAPADDPGMPKCIFCRHFPDCFLMYLKDRRFYLRWDCEDFEDGDWWRHLEFIRRVAEEEMEGGIIVAHYQIVDGEGNVIQEERRREVDPDAYE